MGSYEQIIQGLRKSYKSNASEREKHEKEGWKREERQGFLDVLRQEGKHRLLEIGAGTGQDSQFFQENGLEVVCTDLSPEMVEFCRAKGLTAYTMDFLHLDFPPASFDAIYALNCLLHVPTADLPEVLRAIRGLLRPGGLFYMGLHGGAEWEGINEQDSVQPPRFFAFHSDENIQNLTKEVFELQSFKRIDIGHAWDRHFQSLLLRKPVKVQGER